MRGTKSVPPLHATSCHAVACGPRRRRTTCACHTRGRTHTKIYDRGYQLMYKKYRQILYNCTRLHLPTSRARPRSQRTPGSCLRLVSPPAWTAKAVVGGPGHPPTAKVSCRHAKESGYKLGSCTKILYNCTRFGAVRKPKRSSPEALQSTTH